MKKSFDNTYIPILKEIIDSGAKKHNRTGIDTLSIFNRQISSEVDSEGYSSIPLTNLRKIYYKGAIIEALWILGIHMYDKRYASLPRTNTRYLEDNGVRYWRPWSDKNGNLGEVYGHQLTSWDAGDKKINQIEKIIDTLRTNPDDRRLVCTMWNPGRLDKMALPPCHHTFEFYSRPIGFNQRKLDLRWIQRSADMPIGIPYDMIIYSIINKIVALCTGHIPGSVYGLLGDCHIYENQLYPANELVKRFESEDFKKKSFAKLRISDKIMDIVSKNEYTNLSDFSLDGSDFEVVQWDPMSKMKIEVAV